MGRFVSLKRRLRDRPPLRLKVGRLVTASFLFLPSPKLPSWKPNKIPEPFFVSFPRPSSSCFSHTKRQHEIPPFQLVFGNVLPPPKPASKSSRSRQKLSFFYILPPPASLPDGLFPVPNALPPPTMRAVVTPPTRPLSLPAASCLFPLSGRRFHPNPTLPDLVSIVWLAWDSRISSISLLVAVNPQSQCNFVTPQCGPGLWMIPQKRGLSTPLIFFRKFHLG